MRAGKHASRLAKVDVAATDTPWLKRKTAAAAKKQKPKSDSSH